MADKYGFTFQKQQYRWIHPQARHLVHPSDSDFVAAPETLVEFRRLWVSSRKKETTFTIDMTESAGCT